MIVLRTPKGWTGPAEVDGLPVEGTWRAHQVPLAEVRTNPDHLRQLEDWMRSYRPGELFGQDGSPHDDLLRSCRRVAPARLDTARQRRRAAARPGLARIPRLRRAGNRTRRQRLRAHSRPRHAAARRPAPQRGAAQLPHLRPRRDRVQPAQRGARGDRQDVGGGDAAGRHEPGRDGRVMEILSEHTCQGWPRATSCPAGTACSRVTRRSSTSSTRCSTSTPNGQVSRHLPWRRPVASLNILLTSYVWRQDHNGFSHQDPGSSTT